MIRYRGCCWIRCWTNASLKTEPGPDNLQGRHARQRFWSRRRSPSEIQRMTQDIVDRDRTVIHASLQENYRTILVEKDSRDRQAHSFPTLSLPRVLRASSPSVQPSSWCKSTLSEHMPGMTKHNFFLGSCQSTSHSRPCPSKPSTV